MPHYNVTFFNDAPELIKATICTTNGIPNYRIKKFFDSTYRIISPYAIDEVIKEINNSCHSSLDFIICYTYCSTVYLENGQMNRYEKSE